MAANEHKNLSDINRHNPKGFENATNDTVLGKGAGTSTTGTDGNLIWQNKALMGVTNYNIQGFVVAGVSTVFTFGEDIEDTKSPYKMVVHYNSNTVAGGTISTKNLIRMGLGNVVPSASKVLKIQGWAVSNGLNDITIAICKATPLEDDTANIVPTVIDEFTITGLGNDNKLIRVNETDITNENLLEGDIVFPMIIEDVGGSAIFINLTMETITF